MTLVNSTLSDSPSERSSDVELSSSPRTLKHLHATSTAYWENPAPAYLDTEDARESPMMYHFHRHRHVIIYSTIFALLAYRVAIGRDLVTFVNDFALYFGDFGMGFKMADFIFVMCLISATFASWRAIPNWLAYTVHFGLFATNSVVVSYLLKVHRTAMGSSLVIAMFWAMINMKTHSFFAAHRIHPTASQHYPASILPPFRDTSRELPTSFLSFVAQPSLVYLRYPPKLSRVRVRSALNELSAACASVMIVHLMNTEFLIPSIVNFPFGVKRFLCMFIPSQVIFFLLFYSFFHCGLSFMADLTRYADRSEFYGPWWTAPTSGDYFRGWSMPVHLWLRKHCLQDVLAALTPNGVIVRPISPKDPPNAVPITPIRNEHHPLQSPQLVEQKKICDNPSPPGHDRPVTPTTAALRKQRIKERRRPTAFAYTFASATAFLVSSFLHEQVMYMTLHMFTLPYVSIGLFLVALCMMCERWFGLELPFYLIRTATYFGHAVLFLVITPHCMSAANGVF